MIQLNRFPDGKKKALTFSYDDGHINDVRLIELFNRYGMKATFHLNGSRYLGMSEAELEEVRSRYVGHEIAAHTLRHGDMNRLTGASMIREIMDDRMILEKLAGYPVTGMSYPSGRYSERAIEALRSCGILYSRTTVSEGSNIEFPEEFLAWHPSCHHKNAMPIAERFVEGLESEWPKPLLYIWGHSHELRTEEDWQYMENLIKILSGHEQVWYATNIELYDYVMAQRSLRISADERMIFNPSCIPVWVERDKKDVFRINPGEMLRL